MAKRFFIIDGLSQIFRCYYAPFQPLTAPSGEPTRATYVFTNMLLQLAREQKPDYLAMAMDSRDEEVFRREIATDYKAHRDAMPEDLPVQIERIQEMVRGQGIPILTVPGYEADDILATLAKRLCDCGVEVYLVSRDKDLDQILSDCVKLFDPMKGEMVGPDELRKNKGYGPEQAIEVQTLCGDTTDNIPGVKGVGPKKAAALIAKYGTAAEVVAHADELTPAMRENVKAFADKLDVTRHLVTLHPNVPLEFDLESARWNGVNWLALHGIATRLGFTRLIQQAGEKLREQGIKPASELRAPPEPGHPRQPQGREPHPGRSDEAPPSWKPKASATLTSPPPSAAKEGKRELRFSDSLFDQSEAHVAATADSTELAEVGGREAEEPVHRRTVHTDDQCPPNYTCVDTPEKFRAFVAELKKQKIFAFDTETTSLNPAWGRLAGLSFAWDAGKAYYLPICGVGNCLPLESTLEALRSIFADSKIKKVGQNVKYDLVVLARHGVPVQGVEFDTMIASFVLDSSRRNHGMDYLARELLGLEKIPITDLIGTGKSQIAFDGVETGKATDYSGQDADLTWRLYGVLREQLQGSDFGSLFRETEMPLVEVLAAMETEGVRLDCSVLREMSRQIDARLRELAEQIFQQIGHEFNIDSPKQLANILFDELKLPVGRLTKTGRSTDAETLEALYLQTKNPVLGLIRDYRELIKLKGTYIDTLPEMICPATNRIHTNFGQTTAVTGRLSSSDPNLQNIPIRTEIGRQIRRAFVARDADHVLMTADYSQVELRVLAHFSGDKELRQAFAEDRDIHAFVAAQVFGVPLEGVTKEQRGRAKAVNFGIVYGQSAYGLSRTTGMSTSEAQRFIDMYFMRYPGIRLFLDQIVADARRNGFVRTILGRRRGVPDINSKNRGLRGAAERFAVNTIMQGSAADLIKRAMINIHGRILHEGLAARMIIQVHDELVFDVPRGEVAPAAEMIRHEMCSALPLTVPLKVDLAWGDNWLEGK